MITMPGREENCSAGGGVTRKPIFPTPPPSLLGRRDGRGGLQGGGARPAVNPTSMAQNDTHVALIILTTQMWGGGIIGGKNFFGPNFVFLCLWRQHPFLHKTKGPTRNPISPTPPPPSFGGRPCHPPPPPPQSNFQVALDLPNANMGLGNLVCAKWHSPRVIVCISCLALDVGHNGRTTIERVQNHWVGVHFRNCFGHTKSTPQSSCGIHLVAMRPKKNTAQLIGVSFAFCAHPLKKSPCPLSTLTCHTTATYPMQKAKRQLQRASLSLLTQTRHPTQPNTENGKQSLGSQSLPICMHGFGPEHQNHC